MFEIAPVNKHSKVRDAMFKMAAMYFVCDSQLLITDSGFEKMYYNHILRSTGRLCVGVYVIIIYILPQTCDYNIQSKKMGKTTGEPSKKFQKSIDPDRPIDAVISKSKKSHKNLMPQSQKPRRPVSPPLVLSNTNDHDATTEVTTPVPPIYLRDVQMPAAGSMVKAIDLNANQKNVVRRDCQKLYGYKHAPTEQRKPRVNLVTATSQLAEMMQLAKQRKAAAAALKDTGK